MSVSIKDQSNISISGPPDGKAWTLVSSSNHYLDYYSICYGNGKFVVSNYPNTSTLYRHFVSVSSDGINWAEYEMPVSLSSITFGQGKFVGIDKDHSYVYDSVDGEVWTQVTTLDIGSDSHVYYGDGKFIICSGPDYYYYYSVDGVNWVKTSTQFANDDTSVAYGYGKFVKCTTNTSGAYYYSVDGVNWISNRFTNMYTQNSKVVFGKGKFVIYQVGNIYNSTDGINWSNVGSAGLSQGVELTYGNGKFIGMSTYSPNMVYSVDGVSWTVLKNVFPTGCQARNVTYGNGMFIATVYSVKI